MIDRCERFSGTRSRGRIVVAVAWFLMLLSPALTQAISINSFFVAPGGNFPFTPDVPTLPPSHAVDLGDLATIFDVAAQWWKMAILDPHTVDVSIGWADLSGSGVLAETTLLLGPNPVTQAQIVFDSSLASTFYLDPTPLDDVEFGGHLDTSANLGSGTMNVGRQFYGAQGPIAAASDLLSAAKHELGHVLGINGFSSFSPIDPGLPFGGAVIPTPSGDPAHIDIPSALMNPFQSNGVRTIQSDVDILAAATASGWTQIDLGAHGGPGSDAQNVKWSQQPVHMAGENIASDVDWREIMIDPIDRLGAPNDVSADDFISDGRPIEGVRWWGSHFPGHEPNVQEGVLPDEDGFIISFFRDIPANPDAGIPFSMPGDLLASYIIPIDWVKITGTDMIGWDMHNVVEYEIDLSDAHLDHSDGVLSTPDAFLEVAGEIYWISIAAENGHDLDADWVSIDTGDPVLLEHFWGWHTSPDSFNDVGVTGKLDMFNPLNEWLYDQWQPISPAHGPDDFAFELLTAAPVPIVPGDMNGDGSVTMADAGLFVEALVNRSAYDARGLMLPGGALIDADVSGDIDSSGTFDTGDIADFSALLGGPASANTVPEPSAWVLVLFGLPLWLLAGSRRGRRR